MCKIRKKLIREHYNVNSSLKLHEKKRKKEKKEKTKERALRAKKKVQLEAALRDIRAKVEDEDEHKDERKRGYNSKYDVKAPTEEEIDEWKRKRPRTDDPMMQFMSK